LYNPVLSTYFYQLVIGRWSFFIPPKTQTPKPQTPKPKPQTPNPPNTGQIKKKKEKKIKKKRKKK
jgi:hypothetical protein